MIDKVTPDGEIDENGEDESGQYWPSGIDYICNYKMLHLKPFFQK
jgi:hypothetical protein